MKKILIILLLTIPLLASVSCGNKSSNKAVVIATTTSTDSTGFLVYLSPIIQENTGIAIKWISVSMEQALELGKKCKSDVVVVASPINEQKYIDDGYLTDRTEIMYSEFIIVGPKEDPAGIKGLPIGRALKRLIVANRTFVGRGDNSVVNNKEHELLSAFNLRAEEESTWHMTSGKNMMETLMMAKKLNGYTLTDRETFTKYQESQGKESLIIINQGDPELAKQYSILLVNREKCPKVRTDEAATVIKWFSSPSGIKAIKNFTHEGNNPFIPGSPGKK